MGRRRHHDPIQDAEVEKYLKYCRDNPLARCNCPRCGTLLRCIQGVEATNNYTMELWVECSACQISWVEIYELVRLVKLQQQQYPKRPYL